jgi:hypothetical protein
MSAALSRRFARVCGFPPIVGAPLEVRFELNRLTVRRPTTFEDLPARYQCMILEAEANRQRLADLMEAGDEAAVDRFWEDVLGTSRPRRAARPGPRRHPAPRRTSAAAQAAGPARA